MLVFILHIKSSEDINTSQKEVMVAVSPSFLYSFFTLKNTFIVCVCIHVCTITRVEIRGQTACRSQFPPSLCGSGDQTQIIRLGSEHLYPLSHLQPF